MVYFTLYAIRVFQVVQIRHTDAVKISNFMKYLVQETKLSKGPLQKEDVVCIACNRNSEGDRCESCVDGYFRLKGDCTPYVFIFPIC